LPVVLWRRRGVRGLDWRPCFRVPATSLFSTVPHLQTTNISKGWNQARQQPHTHVTCISPRLVSSLRFINLVCVTVVSFSHRQLAMKVSHLSLATAVVSFACAAKFSLPVSEGRNNLLKQRPSHPQREETGQKVLSGCPTSRKYPASDFISRGSSINVRSLSGSCWRTFPADQT
jgi:hypothetical protein